MENRILYFGYSSTAGGIESFCRNIINNSEFPIDIATISNGKLPYQEEFIKKGCKIFRITPRSKSHIKHCMDIIKLLKEHPEYKIIHCHILSCTTIEPAIIAKFMGKKVILHSHSSNSTIHSNYLVKFVHKVLSFWAQHVKILRFACSEKAGDFMFKNSVYTVFKNGIDTQCFLFNKADRDEIRNELDFSQDTKVYIHIGRYSKTKNHPFLVEIFEEILKKDSNARLLLVGEGELEEEIRTLVKQKGLEKEIIFMGVRKDINKLYSCADVFLLPSLYEGLPFVLVEAQYEGLPCLVSDSVSYESKISPCIEFLSLTESPKKWAEKAMECASQKRYEGQEHIETSYDIESTVNEITSVYKGILDNERKEV